MKKIKNLHFNKIRYLDGKRLKKAMLAGGSFIRRNREHLNKYNKKIIECQNNILNRI